MKQIKLAVLSLVALAIARPPGFCTANTVADNEADIAALKAQVAKQEEELKALRAAQPVPVPPGETLPSSLDLLIKGAGVKAEDVLWRIRAGLSHEQAVEVALAEKLEAEAAKKKEAKK